MADPNASLLSPSRGRPKAAALYQVGLARLQLGDVRGAYEDFKEASRIEPYNMEIWQKYEETYARVEGEIAQEHAAEQQATRQRQQVQSSPGRQDPSGQSEYMGPPPRFTFVAPSEASLQPLQTVAEAADSDAQDRALALQAGMLRGVLGGGRETHAGHEQGRGQGHGQGASHGRGRAMTEGEDREDLGIRYRTEVDIQATNPKIFIGICLCWITVLCNSFLHYSYVHSNQASSGTPPRTTTIAIGEFFIIVVCVIFALIFWRLLKRSRAFKMSLSDGIKVLCVLVIVCCVFYFYVSGGEHRHAAGHAADVDATSLRAVAERLAGTTSDFLGAA